MTQYAKLILSLNKAFISVAVLIGISFPALASIPHSLTINQYPYGVQLSENRSFVSRLNNSRVSSSAAKHYRGRLNDYPQSWVRVSNVNGHWQGIASFGGQQYIINSKTDPALGDEAPNIRQATISAASVSEALTNFKPLACGANRPTMTFSPSYQAQQPSAASAISPPAFAIAQPVAFSALCAATINGVCLIAELELAFDQDFSNAFASTSEATGAAEAILNIVEGFYQEDLDITFERLSIQFLGNNFSNTSDSTDLLNELRDARLDGDFGFLQSADSLFHLLTGRDLDDSTAGVAYVGGICNSFNIGISSLLSDFSGSSNLPLTAIVVAHELGHNFGAEHDIDPRSACGPGFIMEATVSNSNTSFSSCSLSDIRNTIESITSPEQCFDFAVDLAIIPDPLNPATVDDNTEFSTAFSIQTDSIFQAIGQIALNGSIPIGQGSFNSVTLNSNNCTISNQGREYDCTLANPPANSALLITAVAPNGVTNITHTATVTGSSEVQDVDASNDVLQTAVNVVIATPPQAPSNLVAQQGNTQEVNLSWTDNSNNETEFVILRREEGGIFTELARVATNVNTYTDTTTEANNSYEYQVFATNPISDSDVINSNLIMVNQVISNTNNTSSGGGGSFGWILLLIFAMTSLLRRRLIEIS